LPTTASTLAQIQQEIVSCEQCPRLREHCALVAIEKRRAYRDWSYWGKPVPSFGDPNARLVLIGLAPGAHGANRTGRMFTGDSSGDFLYRALYDAGFATQAESRSVDDGLKLRDCYISAAGHCAPPDNKPLPEELQRCRP
jgi:uracil-DNA glycosylase